MAFPREYTDAPRQAFAAAVAGLQDPTNAFLGVYDQLVELTHTQAGQVAALTAERDAERAAAVAAIRGREAALANLATVTAERDALAARVAELEAVVSPPAGRVPAGPAAELLSLVQVRVSLAAADVRQRWADPLRLAGTLLTEAAGAGGIRTTDPRLAALIEAARTDGLVADAELAAAGLVPAG